MSEESPKGPGIRNPASEGSVPKQEVRISMPPKPGAQSHRDEEEDERFDHAHSRHAAALEQKKDRPVLVYVLIFCLFTMVGLLTYATYKTFTATNEHSQKIKTVEDSLGAVNTTALVAKAMATEAANNSSTAMQVSRILASNGDLQKPTGEAAKISPEEQAAWDLMAARKAKEEANRAEFLKLSQKVDAHGSVLAGISDDIQANTKAIAATSNSLTAALDEATSRINAETDGKITLALRRVPTSREVVSLSERVTSMSNTLANAQIKSSKVPKAPKAKETNAVVAVKVGEIERDETQIISGVISRTGHPVVIGGWFSKDKPLTVNYDVTVITPNNTKMVMGEAVFQKFEASHIGLMKDLAGVDAKDAKRLTKLSKALTTEFGSFLEKEKTLPNGSKFIGAVAKATEKTKTP